jgi:hypothetical protein
MFECSAFFFVLSLGVSFYSHRDRRITSHGEMTAFGTNTHMKWAA